MNTCSLSRLLALLVVLTSCGSTPPEPTADPAVVAPAPAASSVEIKAPVEAEPAAVKDVVTDRDAPATRCRDSYLFLVEKTYEAMGSGAYCDACDAFDVDACRLDWPSSDMSPCSEYDVMRNTIYAYYGRPFSKDQWRRHFEEKSWYRADPTYTDARLSEMARDNVKTLVSKHAACMKDFCTPPVDKGMAFMCTPFAER